MTRMTSAQRRAMFAKINKYPSPGDRQFHDVYPQLRSQAKLGDRKAQRIVKRIDETEGWTDEDIAEQRAFQKMITGN